MFRFLPMVFLAGFFLELASLIWVGGRVGVLNCILLVVLGFFVGPAVIRFSGQSLFEAAGRMARDNSPTAAGAGAALLLMVSGLLFMVPGFFSDLIAVVLLIPAVRRWIARRLGPGATWTMQGGAARSSGIIIDAEAVEITGEIGNDTASDRDFKG